MLTFDPKQLGDFCDGLDDFLKEVNQEAVYVYRGFTVAVYHRLLMTTPQWTGNAVSNWNYSVNKPDYSVSTVIRDGYLGGERLGFVQAGPKHVKGDRSEGMQLSLQKNAGRSKTVVFNPVFLTNATSHLGEGYIALLESNPNNFLRTENEPGHMVEKAEAYAGNMQVLSKPMTSSFRNLRFADVGLGAALVGA